MKPRSKSLQYYLDLTYATPLARQDLRCPNVPRILPYHSKPHADKRHIVYGLEYRPGVMPHSDGTLKSAYVLFARKEPAVILSMFSDIGTFWSRYTKLPV